MVRGSFILSVQSEYATFNIGLVPAFDFGPKPPIRRDGGFWGSVSPRVRSVLAAVDRLLADRHSFAAQMLELFPGEVFFARASRREHVDERAARGPHRSAGSLRALPAGPAQPGGDDR